MPAMHPAVKLILPAGAVLAAVLATTVLTAQEPVARLPDGGRYYGPMVDGRMEGRGRVEWSNGAVYEGGFEDGEFSGNGRFVLPGGDIYEGEFHNGMMHGQGRLRMADGSVYAGTFANDAFNGPGVLEGPTGYRYEGELRDGRAHGRGRIHYADGSRYQGEVAFGAPHGPGRYEEPGGGVYEGEFQHGRLSGPGVYRTPTGESYSGRFEDWRLNGKGEYRDSQGNVYRGRFEDGWLTGSGTYVGADGSRYKGEFQGMQFHGQGTLQTADGSVYEGEFRYGRYHGEGTLTYASPRPDGTMRVTGTWEYGSRVEPGAEHQARARLEQALYAQPQLLEQAVSAVAPGDPEAVELYLVTVAGDAAQAVFRRETGFVQAQFAQRFATGERDLALTNSRDTLDEAPMATGTALRRALTGVGQRMNVDQDILFLYLTGHGSEDHELSLNPPGLEVNDLPAETLARILADSGIRWKVVVVSACYSGGFIEPLKDEHTLVLTAARADRASFGCADDNDFTYFGRAFFQQALPESESFVAAFESARTIITEREFQEERTPSLPQMHSGGAIEAQLGRWRQTMTESTTAADTRDTD